MTSKAAAILPPLTALDAADLAAFADNLPQLAWMATPDGQAYWFNQQWYRYTGTTPEEMLGQGWQSVVDPAALLGVVE